MTREEAKDFLPIITAFAEGKTIEVMNTSGHWDEINIPNFDVDPKKYRIKPKPKYRPFRNVEECWQEMQKHQPFGWLKMKSTESVYCTLTRISNGMAAVGINKVSFYYTMLYDNYTFADGAPFGVKNIKEE